MKTLMFILLSCVILNAGTAFNNFGTNWSYNFKAGWIIAGEESNNQFGIDQAMGFVSNANGTVSDIWLAVSVSFMDTTTGKNIKIQLADDSVGFPGKVLEEWIVTSLEKEGVLNAPVHLKSTGKINLIVGKLYWLKAVAYNNNSWDVWFFNNINDISYISNKKEGENWINFKGEFRGAFRVDVSNTGYNRINISIPHTTIENLKVYNITGKFIGMSNQISNAPAGIYYTKINNSMKRITLIK